MYVVSGLLLIEKSYSSKDVKQGLLYIIHGVKSKRNKLELYGVWRDAKLMESAMAGAGTNDKALVYR
jgi:annexin A7/11